MTSLNRGQVLKVRSIYSEHKPAAAQKLHTQNPLPKLKIRQKRDTEKGGGLGGGRKEGKTHRRQKNRHNPKKERSHPKKLQRTRRLIHPKRALLPIAAPPRVHIGVPCIYIPPPSNPPKPPIDISHPFADFSKAFHPKTSLQK